MNHFEKGVSMPYLLIALLSIYQSQTLDGTALRLGSSIATSLWKPVWKTASSLETEAKYAKWPDINSTALFLYHIENSPLLSA